MGISNIYLIWGISIVVLILVIIRWILKPSKCPKCGSNMKLGSWTNKEGKEVSALYCNECGYEEILNIE